MITLYLTIAGYIFGLGAVVVIDIHGFLARKSAYWTRATIQTHKVTKPLIWLGIILAAFGSNMIYISNGYNRYSLCHLVLLGLLVLNGLFLSFKVSPMLLEKEKKGKTESILSPSWQKKITLSFIISVIGWWSSLYFFLRYLISS